jgi:hypothetical protein
LAQFHEFVLWRGCSGHFETLGLCGISIYAWIPDSCEIILNKCDFILFFFSALNLPLALESGSRKMKNSRNPDELYTGCDQLRRVWCSYMKHYFI